MVRPCLSGGDGTADGNAQISLTRQEDGNVSIKLKSELAGLPFYWEFHCTPAPVSLVQSTLEIFHFYFNQFMEPVCQNVRQPRPEIDDIIR